MRKILAGIFAVSLLFVSCTRKKADAEAENNPSAATEGAQVSLTELVSNEEMTIKSPVINSSSQITESSAPENESGVKEESAGAEDESEVREESAGAEDESEVWEDTALSIDDLSDEDYAQKEAENAEENSPEVESVEKRLLDSYNRLKFLEFEKEIFIPQSKENKSVIIQSNENGVTRSFYDDSHKLVKKERWYIKTADDSKLLETVYYEYNPQNGKISRKIVEGEASKLTTDYSEDGLVLRSVLNNIVDKKEILSAVSTWKYDEEKRITEQTSENYNNNGKRIFSNKETFAYHKVEEGEEEIPPDYKYYENGELSVRTDYTTAGTYTNQIYFDKDYSVKTYYENFVKIKDVYIQGGFVIRVKNYE